VFDKSHLANIAGEMHHIHINHLKNVIHAVSTIGAVNNYRRRRHIEQVSTNYNTECDRLTSELSLSNAPLSIRTIIHIS